MRKIILIFSFMMAFMLSAGLSYAGTATIDDSMLSKGIIRASYKGGSDNAIKIMITKGTGKYTYGLKSDGTVESFPLQMGNGEYKVSILENIGGNRYAYVTAKTVDLSLSDSKAVFLNSIQNIDWTPSSKPILKDVSLVSGLTGISAKLKRVYSFMVKGFKYDYEKVSTLKPDYIPKINKVYDAKKGICYDYSSVFASMKRFEGMPVKLVKGYSKNVDGYHAWVEVYIGGKWRVIDPTYDSVMYAGGAKYSMYKNASDYKKVNEY